MGLCIEGTTLKITCDKRKIEILRRDVEGQQNTDNMKVKEYWITAELWAEMG